MLEEFVREMHFQDLEFVWMGNGRPRDAKWKETLDPFYHLTGSRCIRDTATVATAIYRQKQTKRASAGCRRVFTLPVRYCPRGEVQVQSGEPKRRENRHSKWRVEPGKTASSPPGSTEAEPDGILIKTVGGAPSVNNVRY